MGRSPRALLVVAGVAVAALSLQGGAANAQGDLIAASPLADYSPEVPSPRIDDGFNTAEMQDLERIAEQTREPLDQVISRLAWNDNFALAASTLRDAHPDSFTGAEIVAEDRAWISFAGSPPADAWAIIDSFKAIAPHVNVELRGGEGYSELDLQKAIENTHYVLLDSSAVRDANTTFDIEDRIITTAVLLTDGQPESVVSDLEILARRGLSTLPAQAGITSEVIMSSSASLGSNEHNDYHHGGEVLSACTSGFGTRATSHTSGSRAIATAGHCPDTMTDDGHTLTLMGSGYEGTHGDFQRHTGPKTETDDFYAGVATITEDVLRDVSGIGAPTVGQTLCQNGKVTHFNCQQVRKLNVCQGSVCNLVQMGAHLTASGDSGSPVFFGNVAYGIHKGMMYDPVAPFSRGTFSRADRIDNALGVWIATN